MKFLKNDLTAKTPRRQEAAEMKSQDFSSRLSRRLGVLAVAFSLALQGTARFAGADSAGSLPLPHKSEQPANEITPEQQTAVEKGLEYLASQQTAEGSFGNSVSYGATAAITALSGIAFMADGNLPGRGKYGENVRKAVDFIERSADSPISPRVAGESGT